MPIIPFSHYCQQMMLPLEERLLSVSEWSRGFLSGFTQGITQREATGDPIPGMTADALKDMAAIAQVDPEETDSDEAERQLEGHYRIHSFRCYQHRYRGTSITGSKHDRKHAVKISKAEFARRRKNLMGMMDKHTIAIIPGAREVTRSRDTEYPFRQNSDLFYLTGFEEPDAVLVLVPGRRQGQVVLFCRERDPDMELWNGYRLGPEGAVAYLGVDDAFPIDDLDEILPGLIEGTQRIYYSMGHDDVFDQRVMGWVNQIRKLVRTGAAPPADFTDLAFLLHEQRLIKSAAEVRVMRKAGEISAAAHVRAMQECQPGRYEYPSGGGDSTYLRRARCAFPRLQLDCGFRRKRMRTALHRERLQDARRGSGLD